MEWIKDINETISGVVWGVPMLALIICAGLYLSFRTGFLQIFEFPYAMKNTIGKAFKKQKAAKGTVTPFQALTTALAATVGTGNIAGITSAVTLGGAGSIFWLWLSALIGMCTKYAEVVLAVRFRERNKAGEWAGGPMYYIQNGLGNRFKWLAAVFCIFGAGAALGAGNAVQIGNMTSSINSTIQEFLPGAARYEGTISLVIGLIVAGLTALTLFGGVRRIGRVTELIVPFMAAVYILASLAVIAVNIDGLDDAFMRIFRRRSPAGRCRRAAGISIRRRSAGVSGAAYSPTRRAWSAPIAHASSSETNPVMQGLYGIFEVFWTRS